MSALTALLLAPTLMAAPPAEDCGLTQPVALPDFSLVDVNASSSSYGETLSLSDHSGEPVVIYWAYAP